MRQTRCAAYLTEAERARLRALVGSGVAPAQMLTRARILLKADQGEGGAAWADAAIAGALEVHPTTLARIRRRCVEHGLDAALERKRPDRVYAHAFSISSTLGKAMGRAASGASLRSPLEAFSTEKT